MVSYLPYGELPPLWWCLHVLIEHCCLHSSMISYSERGNITCWAGMAVGNMEKMLAEELWCTPYSDSCLDDLECCCVRRKWMCWISTCSYSCISLWICHWAGYWIYHKLLRLEIIAWVVCINKQKPSCIFHTVCSFLLGCAFPLAPCLVCEQRVLCSRGSSSQLAMRFVCQYGSNLRKAPCVQLVT